jgi:hypothetical protein
MGLFKADLLRAFIVGFVIGAAGLFAVSGVPALASSGDRAAPTQAVR